MSAARIVWMLLGSMPAFAGADEFRWSAKTEKAIAALQGQVVRRGGFFELRTRFYSVKTNVDARFTAELGRFMDEMWLGFDSLFPGEKRVDVVPEVIVYSGREEYRAVSGDNSRGMFRWEFETRDGVKTMTEFALYSYTASAEQRKFSKFPHFLLLHEGTHQLIQTRAGFHAVPSWFQEGCAMFLEQWDLSATPEQNVARIIETRRAAAGVADSMRKHSVPPLRELARLDRFDVDGFGRKTNRNYQQAEALFAFLMAERPRRQLLRQAYDALIDGRPADNLLFAGEAGLQLEADWLNWVRRR